jgi:hypothetical protein
MVAPSLIQRSRGVAWWLSPIVLTSPLPQCRQRSRAPQLSIIQI